MRWLFVAGTSTEIGKTFVSRAIAAGCTKLGVDVAAIKPVETGVDPTPSDATALARACGKPELSTAAGLYRAKPPLAPMAIESAGGPATPTSSELVAAVRAAAGNAELALVEGCGGLMVPMTKDVTMLDFAGELGAPIIVVGQNRLGVLSDVLTTVDCARRAGLQVDAVVLNEYGRGGAADESPGSNLQILSECLAEVPVVAFPTVEDSDDALADAAARSGLLSSLKLA